MARCTARTTTIGSRPRRPRRRRAATKGSAFAVLFAIALGVGLVFAPAAYGAVTYVEPVHGGVIVERFHPPPTPYGAGNRGVDERVPPGTPVVASADGEVLFAGEVAGTLHVTLRHDDGLRTSYSFLASITVRVGEHVAQGTVLGLAGPLVHFGVRDPSGTYLDPEALWAGRLGAHLVPGPDDGAPPLPPADERAALADGLGGRGTAGGPRRAMALEEAASDGRGLTAGFGSELAARRAAQAGCTPATVAAPAPSGRRLAILVGGLGSSSQSAAVDRVDLAGLGYAAADVVRFSYRGGRSPDGRGDHGALDAIAVNAYEPGDTTGDLRVAARRLAELIEDAHQRAPGVPLDVIAHSQGGVVARLALDEGRRLRFRPPDLVVTLGTPHQGAELATAAVALGRSPAGKALVSRLSEATDLPTSGVAWGQLSETSDVIAQLARTTPAGVAMLSIGASGDLAVPAGRTRVSGATNVVVHLGGWHAHDELPAQPSVTREIGLARAGMPPGCIPWPQAVSDAVVAEGLARGEATAGLGLARLLGS